MCRHNTLDNGRQWNLDLLVVINLPLQDVHDRALLYYRLLQYNVTVAERVVNPPKQAVSVFADTQSSEIKDRIFDEFNSLSVVYQKVTSVLSS